MVGWIERLKRDRASLPGRSRGHVVLLIDNWQAFRQRYDDLEGLVTQLVVGGAAYGVHVVLSSPRWADIRSAILDNIATRMELRLNDPSDSLLGRARGQRTPSHHPGRGFDSAGNVFQLALARLLPAQDLELQIAGITKLVHDVHGDVEAPPLQMLADMSDEQCRALADQVSSPLTACVGIEEYGLSPVEIRADQGESLMLFGDPGSGRSSAVLTLAAAFCRNSSPADLQLYVVDYSRKLPTALQSYVHLAVYASGPATAKDLERTLVTELTRRQDARDKAPLVSGSSAAASVGPSLVLIIDDFDRVFASGRETGDSLAPFIAGSEDLNFMVVLAQNPKGLATRNAHRLYRQLVEKGGGYMFFAMEPHNEQLPGGRRPAALPTGYAYLISKNLGGSLVRMPRPTWSVTESSTAERV